MSLAGRPARPVLEIDGFVWHAAAVADAPAMAALAVTGDNALLFDLPESAAGFAERLERRELRRAMVCSEGGRAVGAASAANPNLRSLNLRVMPFFADPSRSVAALMAYVRHQFWALPMHRVYAQMPSVPGLAAYLDLFLAAGFTNEGTIRGYGLVRGAPADVVVVGILRGEFDEWCLKHEKRLAL